MPSELTVGSDLLFDRKNTDVHMCVVAELFLYVCMYT